MRLSAMRKYFDHLCSLLITCNLASIYVFLRVGPFFVIGLRYGTIIIYALTFAQPLHSLAFADYLYITFSWTSYSNWLIAYTATLLNLNGSEDALPTGVDFSKILGGKPKYWWENVVKKLINAQVFRNLGGRTGVPPKIYADWLCSGYLALGYIALGVNV